MNTKNTCKTVVKVGLPLKTFLNLHMRIYQGSAENNTIKAQMLCLSEPVTFLKRKLF